jgi:hypothetical protein
MEKRNVAISVIHYSKIPLFQISGWYIIFFFVPKRFTILSYKDDAAYTAHSGCYSDGYTGG